MCVSFCIDKLVYLWRQWGMARRRETLKHPALAGKERRETAADMLRLQDELRLSPDWVGLNQVHHMFLAAYCWSKDVDLATKQIGKDRGWVDDQRYRHPGFKGLMERVAEHPLEFSKAILEQMVPWSIMLLRELMMQTDNKNVQLGAIKHHHSLMAIQEKPEGAEQKGNFLNVNVQMFGDEKKLGEVIEVRDAGKA